MEDIFHWKNLQPGAQKLPTVLCQHRGTHHTHTHTNTHTYTHTHTHTNTHIHTHTHTHTHSIVENFRPFYCLAIHRQPGQVLNTLLHFLHSNDTPLIVVIIYFLASLSSTLLVNIFYRDMITPCQVLLLSHNILSEWLLATFLADILLFSTVVNPLTL